MIRRQLAITALALAQLCASTCLVSATGDIPSDDRATLRRLATAPLGGASGTIATTLSAPPPDAQAADAMTAACSRKVKVVYSGYGEAGRVSCPSGVTKPGG